MQINSPDKTSFGVNLNSRKLRFSQKDFFIKIRGYGCDSSWAAETIKTADTAVDLIRKDTSAENVLKFITAGITKANTFCLETYKRVHSGLLRTTRDGWKTDEELSNGNIVTGYGQDTRYKSYQKRLDDVFQTPLTNPYNNIELTRPFRRNLLLHANPLFINNSLNRIFKLSHKIFPKFIHQEVQSKDMKKVNKTIAEIRWIMAHSTPWTRGSDAISNVYMRAMYKAIGIKTYPLKKGVSLDLEAYCTELSNYRGKFVSYFENPPEIID